MFNHWSIAISVKYINLQKLFNTIKFIKLQKKSGSIGILCLILAGNRLKLRWIAKNGLNSHQKLVSFFTLQAMVATDFWKYSLALEVKNHELANVPMAH